MKQHKFQARTFVPVDIARQRSLEGTPLATFSRRAIAFVLDFFIVALIVGASALPETLKAGAESGNFKMDIDPFHGWELLSLPLYFGLVTYFGRGQTIGKKLLGIRVVSIVHEHLNLWHSLERSLGYGASMLEGGFGFIQYFIHPNRQTVHDRIAETIVIRVESKKAMKSA